MIMDPTLTFLVVYLLGTIILRRRNNDVPCYRAEISVLDPASGVELVTVACP